MASSTVQYQSDVAATLKPLLISNHHLSGHLVLSDQFPKS